MRGGDFFRATRPFYGYSSKEPDHREDNSNHQANYDVVTFSLPEAWRILAIAQKNSALLFHGHY